MKRFRVAFHVESDPPLKPGHSLSGPGRTRYLGVFRPRAQKYRRRKLIAVSLIVGFIFACAALAGSRVGNFLGVWGFVLLLAGSAQH